jgi:hypothetical protein
MRYGTRAVDLEVMLQEEVDERTRATGYALLSPVVTIGDVAQLWSATFR